MSTHEHTLTGVYQSMHPDSNLSPLAEALIALAADVDKLNAEAAKPAAASALAKNSTAPKLSVPSATPCRKTTDMATPAEAWAEGAIAGHRAARADVQLSTLTNPHHHPCGPGGWHDLTRAADWVEGLGDILGNINLQPLSKDTANGLLGTPRYMAALASTLRQAARETRAAVRLAADTARMDPDKRAEHARDDQEWAHHTEGAA